MGTETLIKSLSKSNVIPPLKSLKPRMGTETPLISSSFKEMNSALKSLKPRMGTETAKHFF